MREEDIERNFTIRNSTQFINNLSPRWLLLFDIPLKASFGEPYDPLVFRTGIKSDLRVIAGPGLVTYCQIEWYLHNEYSYQWYAPTNVGVMYARPLMRKTLSVLNAGLFQKDLYGIDGEIRSFLFHDTVSLGGRFGVYGSQYFRDTRNEYHRMDKWMAKADIAWMWPRYDCTFRIKGGRFLYGDTGAGFELSRVFKEVELGFSGVRSGSDVITIMSFRLPFYPSSRKTRAFHHVGFVDAFHFAYRYDTETNTQSIGGPLIKAFDPELGISFRELEGFARPVHFRYMEQMGKWKQ